MTNADAAFAGIRKTLRRLVIATVILYVLTLAAAVYAWQSADSANGALCTLRGDLERRVAASQEFLREHPEGLPKAGITATQIQEGIVNQQRTIASLSDLDC